MNKSDDKRIIYLIFSGGKEKLLEQRGSYDTFLAARDGISNFDEVLLLFYRANNSGWSKLNEKFRAYEQKRFLSVFHILGSILLALKGSYYARKMNVRLVRVNYPLLPGLCGIIISLCANIPLICTIQTDFERRLKPPKATYWLILGSYTITKLWMTWVLKFSDRVLPIREYMVEWLKDSFNVSTNKISVFPQGIDLSRFSSKTKEHPVIDNISDNTTIITFAGRFEAVNHPIDCLKIFNEVHRLHPQTHLTMAGNGTLFSQAQEFVSQNNLDDNVTLLGWIDNHEVCRLYLSSDIGLVLVGGYSLIEAGAGGCALISYDLDWHSEIVKNGKTGFLIEQGDIEDAVSKTSRLIANPKERESLGQNARKLVFKKYDKDKTKKIKENIIEDIMKK